MNIYSVTRANINYYFIPVKYVSAFYYVHFNDLLGCIEFFFTLRYLISIVTTVIATCLHHWICINSNKSMILYQY